MPSQPTDFNAAKLEALLGTAFEAADRAEGEYLDPADQELLRGIASMTPGDLEDGPVERVEDDEMDEMDETPPIQANEYDEV